MPPHTSLGCSEKPEQGVQNRKQPRVDEQGLRIADHLGGDLPPQRLQEAPELPQAPMKRGGVQSPSTAGNKCEKNLFASPKKERSLSTPLSCCKSASVKTSESESRFMDS